MSVTNATTHGLGLAREMGRTQELLGRSLNKLGSGTRLEHPADDPVAVGTSSRLDAQGQRVKAALANVQNGVSYVQTASSFLDQIKTAITRMGELSTLSQDPTKTTADTAQYQLEFASLQSQIRETIGGTQAAIGGVGDVANPIGKFNDRALFNGAPSQSMTIGSSADQQLDLPSFDLATGSLAALIYQDGSGNFTLDANHAGTISTLTAGLDQVTGAIGELGAIGGRLSLATGSLTVEQENLVAVNSRIRDVDVARESTRLSSLQMRSEAGTSMLTQANQSSDSVLSLLRQL